MAFLDININQVNSDFKSIKTAMTDVGVDIPDGTPTSEYAENIGEVYNIGYDAGHTNGQSSMVDGSKIISKTASGVGSLHLNDVSEIPHNVKCSVESVNLFNIPDMETTIETEEATNVTFFSSQGVISMSGIYEEPNSHGALFSSIGTCIGNYATSTPITETYGAFSLPKGTYTFYADETQDEVARLLVGSLNASSKNGDAIMYKSNSTFTVDNDTYALLCFQFYTSDTIENFTYTVKPMLNRGTEALPYTPYVNPEDVTVTVCGKNLFDFEIVGTRYDSDSYKIIDDYIEVTDSYTVTGEFVMGNKFKLPAGTYTITNKDKNKSLFYNYKTEIANWMASYPAIAADTTKVLTFTTEVELRLKFFPTAGGITEFKYPQVEYGYSSTSFERYTSKTCGVDANREVKDLIYSFDTSPYMNIIASNPDVNITAEYHKSYGMQTEYDRFWDRLQNYGNRVAYSYSSGFGAGFGYKNFYPKYDIKPEGNAYQMFADFCQGDSTADLDLVERCKKCGITIDFSNATSLQYLFLRSLVGRVGVIDTRNSTTIAQMFYGATRVHTIDDLILKDDGTQNFNDLFYNCKQLKNLKITGKIGKNGFSVYYCTLLNHDSLMSIIEALADYKEDTSGTNWSITLGTENLAKLTEEEIATATEKGWSLA